MATYPGGKGGSGVAQKIINQMPPHDVYIEAFLGGGSVMDAKRPAVVNIGIDADIDVIEARKGHTIIALCGDAVSLLPDLVSEYKRKYKSILVYMDPPYLGSTRASSRAIYKHEMTSEEDHSALLAIAKSLPCDVMISGYASDLYDQELEGWRSLSYKSMTRGGFAATEYLWMNYPVPFELHDYRYLGENFREREKLNRRKKRWVARLESMPALERYALYEAMSIVRYGEPS